ncbi:MAG: hypothetical protein RXO36_01010 [Candidatus Nanopusillus acidilobi]|jgi:hypothetical protein
MALADYVNQSLDTLLSGYVSEINRLKGLTTDDFVRESLDGYIKTYSEIIGAMKEFSHQFKGQLDPKVNNDFGYILGNFLSKALKDNNNPSQLYGKISDAYNQEIFSKGDEALVILLSKIYIDALNISRNINPITKQYDRNISREARENAAKTIDIVKELLGEALYKHWSSMGKKITKDEIMANLEKHASSFYGAWEGVKGKIESDIKYLTPDDDVKDAVMGLVMELERSYLSFIQGLIVAAYNKRSAPEHIISMLKYLSGKDFFKNGFNEMYNEVGNYINQLQPQIAQYLQLNQPAGQQQGQQVSQPNIPSQQPNSQPQNQVVQVPLPNRISSQNNQQGQQTP